MSADELAIRELVKKWLDASRSGDVATVLGLMSDDVVFMVVGREPFGKREFAEMSRAGGPVLADSRHVIKELQVAGEWAWMRSYLEITMKMPDGKTAGRAGYILTVLRKNRDGSWVIARDANLLVPKTG